MFRRIMPYALAAVFLIFIVFSMVESGRAVTPALADARSTSTNIPDPPLVVWANKGKITVDGLGLRATLFARSATDMPVPGVKVFVTTCKFGQQLPFTVYLGRKLDKGQESFTASKDGKTLTWRMYSAPANTVDPARLPLQFEVARSSGGPTFCVKVWGTTRVSSKPTKVTTLRWQL